MRVAYLNMIKPNGTCPCGLRSYFFQTLVIHFVINLILQIVVVISSFPPLLSYVRGYQQEKVDSIYNIHNGSFSFEGTYIDGVLLFMVVTLIIILEHI